MGNYHQIIIKKEAFTMATRQPIRDKQELQALVDYYLHCGQIRNHVLIVLQDDKNEVYLGLELTGCSPN